MKRIILHIGARKTGSTSIQKYLVENNSALHERGFHYIEAARSPKEEGDAFYAHHRAAQIHKYGLKIWEDVIREMNSERGMGTFVMSSESFYSIGIPNIMSIQQLLDDFVVDIVFVVRDQLDFLKSEYKQRIKLRGERESFTSFVERNIYLSEFGKFIDEWEGIFGKDHVHVLDFDQYKRDKSKDLVRDFCQVIGINDPPGSTVQANVSVEEDRSVTLRFINRVSSVLHVNESRYVFQLKNSIKRKRSVSNIFHAIVNPFLANDLIPEDEEKRVAAMLAGSGLPEKYAVGTPDELG